MAVANLTIFSNYFNSHQLGLALELEKLLGGGFTFVSLRDDLEVVGRKSLDDDYPFVVKFYEGGGRKTAEEKIKASDMVVFGDMGPREYLVADRDLCGKPYLRYTERPFKSASDRSFFGKLKTRLRFAHERKELSVLCAGAYVPDDLEEVGFPRERCYSWGYFPHLEQAHRVPAVSHEGSGVRLVWIGRFIDWKRPEWAIEVLGDLASAGLDCRMTMIGSGPLLDKAMNLAIKRGVREAVRFEGELKREEVLIELERSDIYIMTSNEQEGWGVSLNEAMSAGCASVAAKSVGAVPFLIEHGINGYSYETDCYSDFRNRVFDLVGNGEMARAFGERARDKVQGNWGAEVAARRLVVLAEALVSGGSIEDYNGSCCQCLRRFEAVRGGEL